MVKFLTLFLGLVLGPQTVEVVVGPGVERVVLELDGAAVASLRAPTWQAVLNFGEALLPHRLEAVAFDVEGGVLDRAAQWINVPREPVEAVVSLRLSPDGIGTLARLSWESVEGSPLRSLIVTFDGEPLAVSHSEEWELPAYDPRQFHFLKADLEFENGLTAGAEASFGGIYAESVSSELTATAWRWSGGRHEDLALAERFVVDGREVKPVAIDRGPAEVLLVRDLRARRDLVRMANSRAGERVVIDLDRDERIRFLSPVAEQRAGQRASYRLFPGSAPLSVRQGGLLRYLAWLPWPALGGGADPVLAQQLAPAVAVAGLEAAGTNRRRAVVLLLARADRPVLPTLAPVTLTPEPPASEPLAPKMVRRYLDSLGVPLFVWSLDGEGGLWGPAEDVSTPFKLAGAVRRLRRELDAQRILWFEGRHLPAEIKTRQPVEGVEPGIERLSELVRPPVPAAVSAGGASPARSAGAAMLPARWVMLGEWALQLPEGSRPPPERPILGAPSPIHVDDASTEAVTLPAGAVLRVSPDPSSPVVDRLAESQQVVVVARVGGYLRVRAASRLAWVWVDDPLAEPEGLEGSGSHRGNESEQVEKELIVFASRLPAVRELPLGPYSAFSDVPDGDPRWAALQRSARCFGQAYERWFLLDLERTGAQQSRNPLQGNPPPQPSGSERSAWTITVLNNERDYRALSLALAPDHGLSSGGFALQGVAALEIESDNETTASQLLRHELTHLANREVLGGDVPAWLEEGMAEEFSWSEFSAAGDGCELSSIWPTVRRERQLLSRGGHAVRAQKITFEAIARDLACIGLDRSSIDLADLVRLSPLQFQTAQGRSERYAWSALIVRWLRDEVAGNALQEIFLGGIARGEWGIERVLGARSMEFNDLRRRLVVWVGDQADETLCEFRTNERSR